MQCRPTSSASKASKTLNSLDDYMYFKRRRKKYRREKNTGCASCRERRERDEKRKKREHSRPSLPLKSAHTFSELHIREIKLNVYIISFMYRINECGIFDQFAAAPHKHDYCQASELNFRYTRRCQSDMHPPKVGSFYRSLLISPSCNKVVVSSIEPKKTYKLEKCVEKV